MRLLADENFPLPTIEALRQAGHDVTWVRTDLPGKGDLALLDIAEVTAASGRSLEQVRIDAARLERATRAGAEPSDTDGAAERVVPGSRPNGGLVVGTDDQGGAVGVPE